MAMPRRSIEQAQGDPRNWLIRYLRLQKRYDVEIDAALREASSDAARRVAELESNSGIGAIVRSAQLMTTMTAVAGTLSAFWNHVGDIVRAGRVDASREALEQSFAWDAPLLRLVTSQAQRIEYREMLLSTAGFNVEAMIARVYKSRLPLAQQVYKTSALAQGWVEKRVNSAIARGEPVAQLAREVRDFIDPKTPGGATYAARRLARSEINAAYHAVTIVHNEDKPWNLGMRWRLSQSHPNQDECDSYAREDGNGLGAGVFPRDSVPGKPHPQCLCYVTPEVVTPEEFMASLKKGEYAEWVRANYEG